MSKEIKVSKEIKELDKILRKINNALMNGAIIVSDQKTAEQKKEEYKQATGKDAVIRKVYDRSGKNIIGYRVEFNENEPEETQNQPQ